MLTIPHYIIQRICGTINFRKSFFVIFWEYITNAPRKLHTWWDSLKGELNKIIQSTMKPKGKKMKWEVRMQKKATFSFFVLLWTFSWRRQLWKQKHSHNEMRKWTSKCSKTIWHENINRFRPEKKTRRDE